LSDLVGKERVIWRFDPILLTDDITVTDIENKIERIGNDLHMHTEKLVFSFVDMYRKIEFERIRPPDLVEITQIELKIRDLVKKWGITGATCAETYQIPGIEPNRCIDTDLLNRIGNNHLVYGKDPAQRQLCGCAKSVDIGEYYTCTHRCVYCYAKRSDH
jgi:hypothetical protein